jgi:hypothetical protein
MTTKAKLAVAAVKPPVRLDLGSGNNKFLDPQTQVPYTGVDIMPGSDIVFDLFLPHWTFAKDDSVDAIHCSHFIEHLPQDNTRTILSDVLRTVKDFASFRKALNARLAEPSDAMINFFNECYRILKPGAQMTVIAPWWSSVRSWQDPTHRHAISDASLLYYNKGWREANGLQHYPITADFDFAPGYVYNPDPQLGMATKNDAARAYLQVYNTNTITDLYATLTKTVR